MKEKLIELIKQAKYCTEEELAEYLIDAGLTLSNRETKMITNGDKIRSMSDEKLADFIAKTIILHINDTLTTLCVPHKVAKGSKERAETQCLEWLKQPAEE